MVSGGQRLRIEGRSLRVTNLDKVLYPSTGTTKTEVIQYYLGVSHALFPWLEERIVTRVRWPHGVGGQSFFEKNLPPGAPSWLRSVTIETPGSSRGHDRTVYPVVDALPALVHLVQLGSLELHVPQWRVDEQDRPLPPDRLVIDLDPGDPAGLGECAQVALLVREELAGDDLPPIPVTSGSKGLQLYADLPAGRFADSQEVSQYVKALAERLAAAHRGLVVSAMTKSLRRGKVFLDWSQNNAAKTTICPWSLRGRERPTAAVPRAWEEIEAGAEDPLALDQVSLTEALERANRTGTDDEG